MKASLKFIRLAPRKARLVADLIRGKNVEEALNILQFTYKSTSQPLAKLLKSAVANADQQGGVNVDKLYVKDLQVNGGPMFKRFMPRAMGRASPIRHRTSHIEIELDQRN